MFAEIYGANTLQGGNALPAFIGVIVISGLMIFAFMTAVRVWRSRSTSPGSPSASIDPAMTELRVRLARGEIGDEEYSRKASLHGYPTPLIADELSKPDPIEQDCAARRTSVPERRERVTMLDMSSLSIRVEGGLPARAPHSVPGGIGTGEVEEATSRRVPTGLHRAFLHSSSAISAEWIDRFASSKCGNAGPFVRLV